MIEIRILEPERLTRRGFNGFYRFFLSALVQYAGARPTDEPRPVPRMMKPREHQSAWIRCDGKLVFFDMSDHVQLMDMDALARCEVYFKANLHRGIARRLMRERGLEEMEHKLEPFLFFSDQLDAFSRDAKWRRWFRCDRPRGDVCFVMGVYENLVRDGARSPFEHPDEQMTPAACHFWVRYHTLQALRNAGVAGDYRLTSRANPAIEDGDVVQPNLSRRAFSRCISRNRITMVHTLPHAVFPWKVSESFALGRPMVIDQWPLTETPEAFLPTPGEHMLELFPDTGTYDPDAPLSDPRGYRVLERFPPERFAERAEWLKEQLADRDRITAMGAACRAWAQRVYAPEHVAGFIVEIVQNHF